MHDEDKFLETGYDRKQRYIESADPQQQEFDRTARDLFLRAEIFDERLDSPRFMEPVQVHTIVTRAQLTPAQWRYVQARYRPVLRDYALGSSHYQRRLGYILEALRDKILADYKSVAALKREKAAKLTALMRSRRKPPKAKPESKMSAQGRENIRQGAIRRWAKVKKEK